MEFLFDILLQFVGEVLLQVFAEMIAEVGVRSIAETGKQTKNPVLATIGFGLLGAIAGVTSIYALPHSFIADPLIRRINVVASPLVAGAVMMLIGRRRNRKGQILVGLDRFGYAFVFALAMAVVRYIGVK